MRTLTLVNAGGYRRVRAQAVDLGETRKQVSMTNRRSLLLRTMLALFATSVVGLASTIYSVSPIPFPSGLTPGVITVAMSGINNSGQVAGTGINSLGVEQAFIGTTSGSTLIPLPPGWSEAFGDEAENIGYAINASGQVAGSAYNGYNYQAFIGTTSGSTLVLQSSGYAINASGQVAGSAQNGNITQAFVGGGVIPLPSGWTLAGAFAINDSGQVAGYGYNSGGGLQAFIGTASGSTAIPLPSGWGGAWGWAINASGQVAGYGYNGGFAQAFIFTTLGSTAIPLPAGASSATVSFQSLNDSGVVVGDSYVGGWIFDASDGTQLLNNLVPSGWDITNAISISDSGLILAQGSFNGGSTEYVELDPTTPEPGTCLLAAAGLMLLAFARRAVSRRPRASQWGWCRLPQL